MVLSVGLDDDTRILGIIRAIGSHVDSDGELSDLPFKQAWTQLSVEDQRALRLSVGDELAVAAVPSWRLTGALSRLAWYLRVSGWDERVLEARIESGEEDRQLALWRAACHGRPLRGTREPGNGGM